MVINDKYDIVMDNLGTFVVVKKYTTKVGTPARKDVGYYPTLEMALTKGVVKFELAETELKDLRTVEKKLNELTKTIKTLLSKPDVLKTLKEVTKDV